MTYATAKTAFEAAVAAGPEDTIPPATLRSTVLGMTDALLGLIPAYSGDWLTATVYAANTEFVTNDGASYICIQNHTSGASTEPGTGASWTAYWQTLAAKGQDLLTGTIDVASATTTNIGAANSNVIRVTGTTTITSFGTEVDRLKFVYFEDSLTLTHNATTLVLPGGANITTAAGDSLIAISDASGNWRVINYQYASDVDKDVGLDFRSITDVASASTVDLGAETRDILRITGTTGISSFGTGANKLKLIYFAAALTITHNGTSLILPGGANLTVAANDALIVASDASGNWRTIAHFDADAVPQSFAPTTVASATTTDIGAAATEVVSITGTTTITSFGTTANKRRIGTFAGVLTLTHNATTLILPTGVDITTAAGDCFIAVSDGSGNWRVVSYLRADGSSLASTAISIAPDVIVEDQKTNGTDGGTFTSGAYRTRDLTALARNVGTLASLSSNQFTLPAGTYYIKWRAPAYAVSSHRSKLYNVTDAADVDFSQTFHTGTGGLVNNNSVGWAVVTIAGSKAFEIQHRCNTTNATVGFGQGAFSYGDVEVFTVVEIWKVA